MLGSCFPRLRSSLKSGYFCRCMMMAFRISGETTEWNTEELSLSRCGMQEKDYAVLVLNHGLDNLNKLEELEFISLWNAASTRISVDGATNQLDCYCDQIKLPHIISGDFDSIYKNLLEKFREKGVKIIYTPNQDQTDFTKALLPFESLSTNLPKYIITFWQTTHRLDQIFSVIFSLHAWNLRHKECPIFLLDLKGSISWLLQEGKNVISSYKKQGWCSIVPFLGDSIATSSGLLYNMNSLKLSFDSMISTSNGFNLSDEKVELKLSKPVLWSQNFRC